MKENEEKLQEHLEMLMERGKKCDDENLESITKAIVMTYSLLPNDSSFL